MSADLGTNFQLDREIHRTRQFVVHEATDLRHGTRAGIALGIDVTPTARRGLWRLGRWITRTSHPHLIGAYAHGHLDGRPYFAFQWPSQTLSEELELAAYPAARVREMGVGLSLGLSVLHRRGVRLGAIHPGHVAIADDGAVRLSPWPLADAPPGWGGATAWTSPETVAGAGPSVAADIWSLGAVLLSALVGSGPGQLSGPGAEHLADDLRQAADPLLVAVIGHSMASQPNARVSSAAGLVSALQSGRLPVTHRPVPLSGRRATAWLSAAAVALVLATTAGLGLESVGTTTTAVACTSTPGSSHCATHGSAQSNLLDSAKGSWRGISPSGSAPPVTVPSVGAAPVATAVPAAPQPSPVAEAVPVSPPTTAPLPTATPTPVPAPTPTPLSPPASAPPSAVTVATPVASSGEPVRSAIGRPSDQPGGGSPFQPEGSGGGSPNGGAAHR
jgi:serine/threonine protein kinase